jgi:hypothetical protein
MGRIAGSATGSDLSTSQSVLTGSLARAFIMRRHLNTVIAM